MVDSEDSGDAAPYYCIIEARCRLCQFSLKEHELVFAALDNGRVSFEFEFERTRRVYDDFEDANIHLCDDDHCFNRVKTTVCFHSECNGVRFHSIEAKFLANTKYTFRPPAKEEQHRAAYIRQALSQNLQETKGWPRELPRELWWMIAELLVQSCAVINLEQLVHNSESIGDTVLDLTETVYATYIKVEGRYYVQSLSNKRETENRRQSYLLHPAYGKKGPDDGDERKDMFVAMDHIGIRQVVFVSSDRRDEWCRRQKTVPGVWWNHIASEMLPSSLAIKSNGLLIQEIATSFDRPLAGPSRIGWQLPIPNPPPIISLLSPQIPKIEPQGLRMRHFDCNSPDITGYSIASDGAQVHTILSHKSGEKPDGRMYDIPYRGICFWMYMPVSPGEHLTEICSLVGRIVIHHEVIGITLSTSRGRTTVFGMYAERNFQFQRIVSLTPETSRVYFNQLEQAPGRDSIDFVTFNCENPRSTIEHQIMNSGEALPQLPEAISPPPYTQGNELWVRTSCSMSDLTEIHPCVDPNSLYRPVLGMILYYSGGCRESVGQIRLDWMIEPLTIAKKEKLYFSGKRSKKSWGYVAQVTIDPPSDWALNNWFEVNQAGTLEWWFSSRHTVLFYNNMRLN